MVRPQLADAMTREEHEALLESMRRGDHTETERLARAAAAKYGYEWTEAQTPPIDEGQT